MPRRVYLAGVSYPGRQPFTFCMSSTSASWRPLVIIATLLHFQYSRTFKGAAGESNSHSAASGSIKHQAPGGCTCLWHVGDGLLQHFLLFQRCAGGRSQQCRTQASCGDLRPVRGAPGGHAVLHCLPLWLGLQVAGRAQRYRRALHHSPGPGYPLR